MKNIMNCVVAYREKGSKGLWSYYEGTDKQQCLGWIINRHKKVEYRLYNLAEEGTISNHEEKCESISAPMEEMIKGDIEMKEDMLGVKLDENKIEEVVDHMQNNFSWQDYDEELEGKIFEVINK